MFFFCFGLCVAVYFMVLFRKKQDKGKPYTENIANAKRIYLNLFFLNRKEVVENIIRSKISKSKPVTRALAKRLAVQILTDERLMERIGIQLTKNIPERLDMMGIEAVAAVGYTQSAFLCIEVTLVKVDLARMVGAKGGPERIQKIQSLIDRFTTPSIVEVINQFFLSFLSKKLLTNLPSMIKEKLQFKMNAEIEVITCSEEHQGPFLIQTIHQLNCLQPKKATEPIKKVEETVKTEKEQVSN